MGRPSKYKKEYCEAIIAFMTEGKSVVQFAASIGVSKHSIYEWVEHHPDFSDSFQKASSACESYWEKIVQAKTVKKIEGSDAVLIFYLKNRFRWTDRVQQDVTGQQNITFTSEIADDGTVQREKE